MRAILPERPCHRAWAFFRCDQIAGPRGAPSGQPSVPSLEHRATRGPRSLDDGVQHLGALREFAWWRIKCQTAPRAAPGSCLSSGVERRPLSLSSKASSCSLPSAPAASRLPASRNQAVCQRPLAQASSSFSLAYANAPVKTETRRPSPVGKYALTATWRGRGCPRAGLAWSRRSSQRPAVKPPRNTESCANPEASPSERLFHDQSMAPRSVA